MQKKVNETRKPREFDLQKNSPDKNNYKNGLNEPNDVFEVHVLIRHVSDETSSIVSCTESNEVVQ